MLKEFFKDIVRDIKNYISLKLFRAKWRDNNKNNRTRAKTIFPIDKVKIDNRNLWEFIYTLL